VSTGGVTDGQVLAYNNSTGDWEPTTIAADAITEGNSSVEVVDTGTGHVKVTVDGSEKTRVTPTGLGIGTTSPAAELEIEAPTPEIRIDSTGSSARNYKIHSDGDELYIEGIGSSGSLFIGEDGIYGFRIDLGNGDLSFNSGYGSAATAYGCRAWVNFYGTGTVGIRDSGSVSSITDNGTGDYTVNLSITLPDTNGAPVSGSWRDNTNAREDSIGCINNTTTSIIVRTGNNDATIAARDYENMYVAIFR